MTPTRQRVKSRHAAPKRYRTMIAGVAVAAAALSTTAAAVSVVGDGPPETAQSQSTNLVGASDEAVALLDLDRLEASRNDRASRTAKRITLEPQAADRKFATAKLNVWTQPREKGKNVNLIAWGSKIAVTGQVVGNWAEILVKNDQVRWVNNKYLADRKPKPEPVVEAETAGSSAGPAPVEAAAACTNGTSVPAGVSPNVAAVHEAVCAAFPEISTYGTFRSDGEHSQGLAVDIMVSGARGQEVAEFVRANYAALGVNYIIYSQTIWSVDRSGEGWRGMEDRGSSTANHYDHVHVTTY